MCSSIASRPRRSKIEGAKYLAQGTLYPDVIESGAALDGPTETIKLHHNVGGLPAELGFELIEPLRDLFKDEVRQLGLAAGIAGRNRVAASVSGAGAGGALSWRGDEGAARYAARGGCDRGRRNQGGGLVSADVAGVRRAAAGASRSA